MTERVDIEAIQQRLEHYEKFDRGRNGEYSEAADADFCLTAPEDIHALCDEVVRLRRAVLA